MSVFDMNNVSQQNQGASAKPLIMLVDDEVENINVLRQLLESNFQIITGINGREALQLIDNMVDPQQVQLIISDQRMPELTGIEFFEKIVDKMPETIRIILTGYSDTQVIIDSINKAKLYKFMTKPFDPVELSLTVQRGVEAFQMRREILNYTTTLEQQVIERTEELLGKNNELALALDKLEEVSLTDQLTGARNRHFLEQFLPQELAKFKRDNSQNKLENNVGFIMLDIDLFKMVNDEHGHAAGDNILKQFTLVLKETCRESDWIVRWGGEEFIVVARGLTSDGLENLAERIRKNIESHEFNIGVEHTIKKTCSLGIVSYPFIKEHVDELTWEHTLNLADMALYVAKNNGRNTWVRLFENEIKHPETFYQEVTKDLHSVIASSLISYSFSGRASQIEF